MGLPRARQHSLLWTCQLENGSVHFISFDPCRNPGMWEIVLVSQIIKKKNEEMVRVCSGMQEKLI